MARRPAGLSLDPQRQHNSATYHQGYEDGALDRQALRLGEEPAGPLQSGWMYEAGYGHGLAGEPES